MQMFRTRVIIIYCGINLATAADSFFNFWQHFFHLTKTLLFLVDDWNSTIFKYLVIAILCIQIGCVTCSCNNQTIQKNCDR